MWHGSVFFVIGKQLLWEYFYDILFFIIGEIEILLRKYEICPIYIKEDGIEKGKDVAGCTKN